MLSNKELDTYKEMAKNPGEYRSFQAFTSSSRNKNVASTFSGSSVLFIMETEYAFTTDIAPFSEYPNEEEELITPGVCFTIYRVEFDESTKQHLVYMKLRNRFSRHDKDEFQKHVNQASGPEYNVRAGRITGDLLIGGVDIRDLVGDGLSSQAYENGDTLCYDRDDRIGVACYRCDDSTC